MVRVSTVTAWAIVAGAGLGLGLWALVGMLPRLSRPRLAKRVAPYLADVSPAAREWLAPAPPGPLPVLGMLLDPVLSRGRTVLSGVLGGGETLQRRLRQAGSTLSVEAFRSQQVLSGLAGAAVGTAVAVAAMRLQSVSLLLQLAAVVVFGMLGVLARDTLLQRAAKARLGRLGEELPVVLEFMTLSLAAGEGIGDALRRVARTGREDKVRTYNYSQNRVTDHRSGKETLDLDGVLAGAAALETVMDSVREWMGENEIKGLLAEEELKKRDEEKAGR